MMPKMDGFKVLKQLRIKTTSTTRKEAGTDYFCSGASGKGIIIDTNSVAVLKAGTG